MKTRVVRTRSDWKVFFSLPYVLYRDDPHWVAPLLLEEKKSLDPAKNPFFHHGKYQAWLVEDSSGPMGRILAFIDDKHNDYHEDKTGFIGYFECRNSEEAARALFDQASLWLKDNGMETMRGPVNLSVSNECGVLLTGFNHPPYIKMGHSLPYYKNLFEEYGFTKEHELLAYILTSAAIKENREILERLDRVNRRVLISDRITIRCINMKEYTREVALVFKLYNHVMSGNWGFVPATREEMEFMAKSLRPILDPEMVYLVEKDGEIVGCSLSVPNLNQILPKLKGRLFPFGIFRLLLNRRKINGLRLMLIGILPGFRERGLEVMLILKTIRKGIERGYGAAELSWISEDNKNLIGILDKLGAEPYKTYAVYDKALT